MKLVSGYRNIHGGFTPPISGLGRYGGTPPPPAGDVPPEYAGNPVFLSASAYIQPKSPAAPNNEGLRNLFGFPIEIHEIRFTAFGLQNKTVLGYGSPGPQLAVAISLGDVAITKDFVPIYCICPGAQINNESRSFIVPSTAYPAYFACNYRMALKTPILMKPREVFLVEFENRGYVPGSTQISIERPGATTMIMGLLGRTREDLAHRMPHSRTVPYFASWSPQALIQPASGSPATATSKETDLMNQSSGPVRLSRIMGRMAAASTSTGYAGATIVLTELTDSDLSYDPGLFPAPEAIRIGMIRSNGLPIIAAGTPFRLAFDGLTRSWEIDDAAMVLNAGDYMKATLEVYPPDSGIGIETAPMLASVGLTGYREVSL